MTIKIKAPYRITNTVIIFENDKGIAWRHLMKWRWCYELVVLGEDQAQVTKGFDTSEAPRLPETYFLTDATAHHIR